MRLSSTPLKIIPRISRMDKNRPHGRRQRHALALAAISRPVSDNPAAPCPVPGPSPEPDRCRTLRQTGSVKGRRSRSRVTPKAPLTGSGCREHSNGGFGGGHPHFHPHATPTSNPRIKRQTQPAPKPSGSARAFGVNRIVPLGWSEGIQRHPAALLLALLLLARWSARQRFTERRRVLTHSLVAEGKWRQE